MARQKVSDSPTVSPRPDTTAPLKWVPGVVVWALVHVPAERPQINTVPTPTAYCSLDKGVACA